MRPAVFVVLTAACAGGSSPPARTPEVDPLANGDAAECQAAADQLGNQFSEFAMAEGQISTAEEADALRATFAKDAAALCQDQQWSTETRTCFRTAQGADGLGQCVRAMSPEQRDGFLQLASPPEPDREGSSKNLTPPPPPRPPGAPQPDTSGADPDDGGE